MQHTIRGEIAQYARLDFDPGDACWAAKGSILGFSSGVNWRLRVPGGAGGAVRRSFSGESMALTFIEPEGPGRHALLSSSAPGRIFEWDLADGPVLTTRGSFLAAWGAQVDITVTVARRAGAAFFGGAGLFLQHISGRGTVLIHGSGDLYDRRLEAGEELHVSTGNLAAFSNSVDYDIRGVGGGAKWLFGGQGLFMTRLTGPGRVLLQSLQRGAGVRIAAQ